MGEPQMARGILSGQGARVDEHSRVLPVHREQQVHGVPADRCRALQAGDATGTGILLEPVGELLAESGRRRGTGTVSFQSRTSWPARRAATSAPGQAARHVLGLGLLAGLMR
ncbi:hypothetical protein [Streptomyces sp. NPDC005989]|uniref:hypothetical protein n=1 Tax=Streptomyces sp. NPDC005989 TaxID=3156727 RepID=UPI0033F60B42